jgi:hypothetical protein
MPFSDWSESSIEEIPVDPTAWNYVTWTVLLFFWWSSQYCRSSKSWCSFVFSNCNTSLQVLSLMKWNLFVYRGKWWKWWAGTVRINSEKCISHLSHLSGECVGCKQFILQNAFLQNRGESLKTFIGDSGHFHISLVSCLHLSAAVSRDGTSQNSLQHSTFVMILEML